MVQNGENKLTEKELIELIKYLDIEQLKGSSEHENTSKQELDDEKGNSKIHGRITVIHNEIHIENPTNGGMLPVIRPVDPVTITKNGENVRGEIEVSSSDKIEWFVENKPLFEVMVTSDKLQALVQLKSKKRYLWRLKDQQPSCYIELEAVEDHGTILESVSLADIVSSLEKKSIHKNIDFLAIDMELENPTYHPIVVARGKAPIPGNDAKLEVYFNENVESRFFETQGIVDYRNHLMIPNTKKTDIIAKKIPLVKGVPGYDVHGDIIIPEHPKDITIVAKNHIQITEDGKVIALKDGRPRITGHNIKYFDISDTYIVAGDVDIETGNIVFFGDVVVYGDVKENMIIESLGNIYVFGGVFNATLSATGSIFINGNIIGSKVYSGYFGVLFNRLYKISESLTKQLKLLLDASLVLESAIKSKNHEIRYAQIILLLLENKFKEIPKEIRELLAVISSVEQINKQEFESLKSSLMLFLMPSILLQKASYDTIHAVHTLLTKTYEDVARMQETDVQIKINQCYYSTLKSNGDIYVQREGVMQSELYSLGNITFYGEASVCRASKLEAEGIISAENVGNDAGSKTVLKAKKKIMVKKMLSGRVCIDRYCAEILETCEDLSIDAESIFKMIKTC